MVNIWRRKAKKHFFRPGQIIALLYFMIILFGAILLTMRCFSTEPTKFIDALFVSTSAICVTGLTPVNTALHWNVWGKLIIITLIQIGGLGIMTVVFMGAIIGNLKIGLKERVIMQDVTNSTSLKGIVLLGKFIAFSTIYIELLGAILLYIPLSRQYTALKAIGASIFYSISAFCNAGFDLTGESLVGYTNNSIVNIVIMLLIIIGGIGFFTLKDIKKYKLKIKKYTLQSKIIIFTTVLLITIPAFYFFVFEFSRDVWNDLTLKEKILASLFQAVTPRTAGFNTIDLCKMNSISVLIYIVLMLTGGAPSSTAGGFKVTTFFILVVTIKSYMMGRDDTEVFNKRLDTEVFRKAIVLCTAFIMLTFLSAIMISLLENVNLSDSLFEAASAIGTVGLTRNLTANLSIPSKLILIMLMFFGRVGCLSFLTNFRFIRREAAYRLPVEDVAVG